MTNIDIEVNLVQEYYRIVRVRESVKRRFRNCFVCKGMDEMLFETKKLPQSRPRHASEKLLVNDKGAYFVSPLYEKQMNQMDVNGILLFLHALPR